MRDTFDTARTEAFSDGVFAIAITLLVLDISVPAEDFSDLLRGILDQWPSYLAFGTSFWTIAGIWLVHHGIFRRMRYGDMQVMWLNLTLLLAVSFLPFPTRLVAEAISSTDAERVAVLFYAANLLVISALAAALGRYAAGHEALRGEGVSEAELLEVAGTAEPGVAFYGTLIVLAVFVPQVAAFGLFVVSLMLTAAPVVRRPRRPRAT